MRVVSIVCVLAGLGACVDSSVVVPELELPLCPVARPDEPDTLHADIGVLREEAFQRLETDPGVCPEPADSVVCPVFNSWRAVSGSIAVRAKGIAPRDVNLTIQWEIEGQVVDAQQYPSDLVCNGVEPEPILLPIGFGQQFGLPEDFRCRPGRLRVTVAPSGLALTDCTAETCLIVDEAVAYTLDEQL